jgi:ferredoxin/flavodoxin---NADP+ reductase
MGPLGKPTHIEPVGHAVLVGGGVGTAVIYPLAPALRETGAYVSAITGGRTRELVVLEDELKKVCDAVYATTDDGSYGFRGTVADKLRELIRQSPSGSEGPRGQGAEGPSERDQGGKGARDQGKSCCCSSGCGGDTPRSLDPSIHRSLPPVGAVYCAGPVPMMRAIAELTRPLGIKTIVSLNPIMVDGTGMCGGCRVTVGGKTQFACVDGPEFDGHQVDYAELSDRLTAYRTQEKTALERAEHACKLGVTK